MRFSQERELRSHAVKGNDDLFLKLIISHMLLLRKEAYKNTNWSTRRFNHELGGLVKFKNFWKLKKENDNRCIRGLTAPIAAVNERNTYQQSWHSLRAQSSSKIRLPFLNHSSHSQIRWNSGGHPFDSPCVGTGFWDWKRKEFQLSAVLKKNSCIRWLISSHFSKILIWENLLKPIAIRWQILKIITTKITVLCQAFYVL